MRRHCKNTTVCSDVWQQCIRYLLPIHFPTRSEPEMSTASDPSTATGDLPTDAFRKHGHELIDTMWKPSPRATKLGIAVVDWLRQALGLKTPWFGTTDMIGARQAGAQALGPRR